MFVLSPEFVHLFRTHSAAFYMRLPRPTLTYYTYILPQRPGGWEHQHRVSSRAMSIFDGVLSFDSVSQLPNTYTHRSSALPRFSTVCLFVCVCVRLCACVHGSFLSSAERARRLRPLGAACLVSP